MFSPDRLDGVPSPASISDGHGATKNVFAFDSVPSCMTRSPDNALLVVGGKDLFRVLRTHLSDPFEEILNPRLLHPRGHGTYACNDVRWIRDGKVASAGTNGSVVVWDLENQQTKYGLAFFKY